MLTGRRSFGSTGMQVFALGMGCSRLGSFLSTVSRPEIISTIRAAVDEGIDYFDTSDLYGQGESERLLGEALVGNRNRVLIATKAGRRISSRARLAARIKAPIKIAMRLAPSLRNRVSKSRDAHLSFDFNPQYLTAALHASLKRLRTDHVDVFMLHSPPVGVLSNHGLFQRLAMLKDEGKIRCLGISVAAVEHADLASRAPGVGAIQMPIGRRYSSELGALLPALQEQGIAVVGREVFDGLVAGDDRRLRREVLQKALSRPELSVVLVGMSRLQHLEANCAAMR